MLKDAITYNQLFTNIRQIKSIHQLLVTNQINQHAQLELTGILKNSSGEDFIHLIRNNDPVRVGYIQGDQRFDLFCGTVTSVKVEYLSDVYLVRIKAKSNTYLLDIHKRSRSFQDITMTTHQLVGQVAAAYPGVEVDIEIPDQPIGQLIIQYNETDFEFLKRFASMYFQGITPQIDTTATAFSIGIKRFKPVALDYKSFSVYSDIEKYQYMSANFIADALEADYINYIFSSYEICHLHERIQFGTTSYYIGKAEYRLIGSLLECNYYGQRKAGLMQKRLYNSRLIGISIPGTVLLPQRDQLKVHLKIDAGQDPEKAYLFPYSTISASSDGSGWYNMPEIGDQVRVYFPTKDEKEAFSISSASEYIPAKGSETDRMGNPDIKYIRTKQDKEVKFTAEGIFISSDATQAEINLLKNGDVIISGQNSIIMRATENVTMEAEKEVLIQAKESIKLECEANGSIELGADGNTTIKGFEVKSN